jgi:hypothetical protein
MIRRVKRVGTGLMFALFGFVSLIVADKVGQLLCAHLGDCRRASDACPIDVCEGDVRLNLLRIAVWMGPAVVFGTSVFMFGGQQRPLTAWLTLLATLVVAHAVIMIAAR